MEFQSHAFRILKILHRKHIKFNGAGTSQVPPFDWSINMNYFVCTSFRGRTTKHLVCWGFFYCDARPVLRLISHWSYACIRSLHRTHQYYHSIFIVVGMCARATLEWNKTKRKHLPSAKLVCIRRCNPSKTISTIYWRFSCAVWSIVRLPISLRMLRCFSVHILHF